MKTSIAILASLSLALVSSAQLPAQQVPRAGAKTDYIANVYGRGVHIHSEGLANGPVVVFENGLGATLESWSLIFADVAKFAHVFAYDRAGTGQSGLVNSERSYKKLAAELHETLQSQKLAPPYILAAHSFGAIVSRAFYAAYPKEVAGILFVDPMSENFVMSSSAKLAPSLAERLKGLPGGVMAEAQYVNQDAASLMKEVGAFGVPDVPMTLLVARSVRPEGWERALLDKYQPWIMAREDSSIVVTPDSAQFIQRDEPALVVDALHRMIFPRPQAHLRRTLKKSGVDATIAQFRADASRYPRADMTPEVLNGLGYEELEGGRVDNAIKLFALNVEAFPDTPNVYDSLGEAYAAKGDKTNAITNYQRSLELDPKNVNAVQALAKLRSSR